MKVEDRAWTRIRDVNKDDEREQDRETWKMTRGDEMRREQWRMMSVKDDETWARARKDAREYAVCSVIVQSVRG